MKNEIVEFLDQDGIANAFFTEEVDAIDKTAYSDDLGKDVALPEGWEFSLVERYGGEDQGSEFWSVYEFKKGDFSILFKFDGWYQSYNGSEFEEYFEVVPAQETITVYNRV